MSGAEIASYVIGVDGTVLSQSRAGDSHYYLADAQHSTRLFTNAAGTVSDSYAYSAYREETANTGSTPNAYRYTGQAFDTEPDLYSNASAALPSWDRYGYTANNPTISSPTKPSPSPTSCKNDPKTARK